MSLISNNSDSLSTKVDLAFLKAIGLSKYEAQVYITMVATGKPFTAQEVASVVMVFPSAVYRIFKTLEQWGLVRKIDQRPVAYIAPEKNLGLMAAYKLQQQRLRGMLLDVGVQSVDQEDGVLVGRQQLYDTYIQLASRADSTIDIFSAGIAFSEALFATQKNALHRHVAVRHIVQHVDSSNYHIIHKWQELGVAMRRLNTEQGFHLTIIDGLVALVTFSKPDDTEDRLTIVTRHTTATSLFSAQFEQLWQQASNFDSKIKK